MKPSPTLAPAALHGVRVVAVALACIALGVAAPRAQPATAAAGDPPAAPAAASAAAPAAATPRALQSVDVLGTVANRPYFAGGLSHPEPDPLRVATAGGVVEVALAFNHATSELAGADRQALQPGRHVIALGALRGDGGLDARSLLVWEHRRPDVAARERAWPGPAGPVRLDARIARVDEAPGGGAVVALEFDSATRDVAVTPSTRIALVRWGSTLRVYEEGAPIYLEATRQRDGTLTAGRVFVAAKGFVPPF